MNTPGIPVPDSSGITAEMLQAELPQFEVERMLGMGGMGVVFKARQPRLERDVAIKLLTLDCTEEPQFKVRFEREAQAMARLQHKRIIAVYDTGVTPGGWPYIVMEFVDGVSLAAVRKEAGRVPQTKVLALMIQICDALHCAHEQGIVHRDIKPANIMLDTEGRVKMADFGLAKMLDNGPGNIALTRTNTVLGTMAYMAPEQLMALPDVDARADIYSLGVMLYELLTGKTPRGAWAPPSQLVDGLDTRFDDIVGRALQEDCAARYPSVVEMWNALLDIRNRPGGAAVPETPQAQPAQSHTIHPSHPSRVTNPAAKPSTFPWTMAAVTTLIVGAGLAWQAFRPRPDAVGARPSVTAVAPTLPEPVVPRTPEPPKVTTPPPATPARPVEPTLAKPAPVAAPAPAPADPKPAPAPPAAMPAAVEVKPAAKPAAPSVEEGKPLSRLAPLLAPLVQRYRNEVVAGYGKSVATLNANYARALSTAMGAATTRGDLDAVVALRGERDQVQQLTDKPLRDTTGEPAALAGLRQTYVTTLAGYQRQRDRIIRGTFAPELRRILQAHAAELPNAKSNPAAGALRALGDRLPEMEAETLHGFLTDERADLIAATAARQRPRLQGLPTGKIHGAGVRDKNAFTYAPGAASAWFLKAPAQTVQLLGTPAALLALDGTGTLSGAEFSPPIPARNKGIVDAALSFGGQIFIYDDGHVAYSTDGTAPLFVTPPPAHLDLAAVNDAVCAVTSNKHFGLLHENGRVDLWARDGAGTKALPVPADAGMLVRLHVLGWDNCVIFGRRMDGSFVSLVPAEESPPVKFLNGIPERVTKVDCGAFSDHMLALTENGKVHAWEQGNEEGAAVVPADLGPATDIRAGKWLSAARVAGGRWRAWGSSRYGIVDKINALDPKAYDLIFHDWDLAGGHVFWLEP